MQPCPPLKYLGANPARTTSAASAVTIAAILTFKRIHPPSPLTPLLRRNGVLLLKTLEERVRLLIEMRRHSRGALWNGEHSLSAAWRAFSSASRLWLPESAKCLSKHQRVPPYSTLFFGLSAKSIRRLKSCRPRARWRRARRCGYARLPPSAARKSCRRRCGPCVRRARSCRPLAPPFRRPR